MMSESTQNINIRHIDHRGLNILIGIAVLFVLFRLWWSGTLEDWGFNFFATESVAYGSATYMLLTAAINIAAGIGAVVTMVASGIWAVINDFIQAGRQLAAERRAKSMAETAAGSVAVQTAIANGQPGATSKKLVISQRKLVALLEQLDSDLKAANAALSQLSEDFSDRSMAADQVIDTLRDRIEALEQRPIPVVPAKTTRGKTNA